MENEFRFLEFEGIQIAAFIEGHSQDEHSGYHPNNILFYVQQGQLNIRMAHKLYTIPKGNFCIVKKFTELFYFKTWEEEEKCAMVDAMILQDDFIKSAIKELGYKTSAKEKIQPVINLGNNPILMGLRYSIKQYITDNQSPSKHLMYLKTKEALLGIIQSSPNHLSIFYEFSKPVKADLDTFMNHHCFSNLSLNELAKLSGRSLSTFNRDFRKLYNVPPHSWLLRKRLFKARELLLTTTKKSSDISTELGFKDLAHFSRVFKKEFNKSPSELRKK